MPSHQQNPVAASYVSTRQYPGQRRTLLPFHQSHTPTLSPILYFFARPLPRPNPTILPSWSRLPKLRATHTYLIFTIRSPSSILLDPLPSKTYIPRPSSQYRLPDRRKTTPGPIIVSATNQHVHQVTHPLLYPRDTKRNSLPLDRHSFLFHPTSETWQMESQPPKA